MKAYRAIWISIAIALGLGILYLVFMCCAPNFMVYTAISAGGLSCIAVGILLMVQHSKYIIFY